MNSPEYIDKRGYFQFNENGQPTDLFNPLIIVDADSIYVRAALRCEKKDEVRKWIRTSCRYIKQRTGSNNLVYAVKGDGNFRYDYYKDYKGNRKRFDDAVGERIDYGRQYFVEKLGAVPADGMEADDLVTIWAHEAMKSGTQYVVAGIDKDLKQIPGWHFDYGKFNFTYVWPEEAYENLMLQCLTGDSGDNIPGLYGIGKVKAEKILKGIKPERMWKRVRAAWRAHGTSNPEQSWRLLKMLESWEEWKEVQEELGYDTQSEADQCEQDVGIQLQDEEVVQK